MTTEQFDKEICANCGHTKNNHWRKGQCEYSETGCQICGTDKCKKFVPKIPDLTNYKVDFSKAKISKKLMKKFVPKRAGDLQ
jgi:formate dehydrogenase assembly factor FdhD